MKDLKKWVFALMASFMLIGVASGCSNSDTKTGANTDQIQDNGTGDSQNNGSDQGTDKSGK